jgi:uncharacterized protein (DUF427 family)
MEQILSPTSKPIKVPGPDHPIAIERNPNRVVISLAGRLIANTRDLDLRGRYSPVSVSREDVDLALLEPTDHTTYCPYKGDCAYFSIPAGGARVTHRVPMGLFSQPLRQSRIICLLTLAASTQSTNNRETERPFFRPPLNTRTRHFPAEQARTGRSRAVPVVFFAREAFLTVSG